MYVAPGAPYHARLARSILGATLVGMWKTGTLAVGIVLVCFAAVASAEPLRERPERPAREPRGDAIPGQYIVVFNEGVNADDAEADILVRTRGERLDSYRYALSGVALRIAEEQLDTVRNDPRVAFVSEDREVSIARHNTITAQAQSLPTGINRMDAEHKTNTGVGVHVAVIDTGILATHPDLAGQVVGGKSCVRASGGFTDQNGHGTHVAGTIAALNNAQGVVGVAPGTKLWAVRVLDKNGRGSWSSVICGLDFVTSKAPRNGGPIRVANVSLGGAGSSDNDCGYSNNDALHRAVCRARDAGVVLVVAAGNSGANAASAVPAAYNDAVITVSALADSDGMPDGLGAPTSYGADDTFATFSNWGAPVDIGAPGVAINSTWLSNGYRVLSGTSMASPHVAGAAALYLAAHPSALWSEVRDALISASESLGNGHTDPSGKHPEPVVQADAL